MHRSLAWLDSRSPARLGGGVRRLGGDLLRIVASGGAVRAAVPVDPLLEATGRPAQSLRGTLAGRALGPDDEVVHERVRIDRVLHLRDVTALVDDDLPGVR